MPIGSGGGSKAPSTKEQLADYETRLKRLTQDVTDLRHTVTVRNQQLDEVVKALTETTVDMEARARSNRRFIGTARVIAGGS